MCLSHITTILLSISASVCLSLYPLYFSLSVVLSLSFSFALSFSFSLFLSRNNPASALIQIRLCGRRLVCTSPCLLFTQPCTLSHFSSNAPLHVGLHFIYFKFNYRFISVLYPHTRMTFYDDIKNKASSSMVKQRDHLNL